MIKVRAIAIVPATVQTEIVAFADIGIGSVLCLFIYFNSPYTNTTKNVTIGDTNKLDESFSL